MHATITVQNGTSGDNTSCGALFAATVAAITGAVVIIQLSKHGYGQAQTRNVTPQHQEKQIDILQSIRHILLIVA
jgi:hypothetical protein